MPRRRKKKKKKTPAPSKPEVQLHHLNTLVKTFHPTILARLCTSLAEFLDIGLTREQEICLYKECLEIACCTNDIHLKIQLIHISFSKKIPLDSRLKELYVYLLQGGKVLENKITYYKKCIEVAKATGDRNVEMDAYESLEALNMEFHQYYDVIVYSKKCLAIAEEIGDKRVAMTSCFFLGRTLRDLNQKEDAIFYFKKCIDIAKEIGVKSIEMTACFIVGKLHFLQSSYREAVLYSERSLGIAKAIGEKRYESMVYLLIQDCQFHLSEFEDAINTGQKSIASAKEIDDKVTEINAYAILGKTYKALKQFENAIHYAIKSVEIANETGDTISAMNEYFWLGTIYRSMGQLDNAIKYTMKCHDMAKETGERSMKTRAYLLLGDIYSSFDKSKDAVMYLKKCLSASENDETIDHEAHFLLGKMCYAKSRFDTAITHFKICLEINTQSRKEASVYMALGDSYLKLEQHEIARDYLQKCLDIAKEMGDKHAEGDAHHLLGKTFDLLHQGSNAILHFQKCIAIFNKAGMKDHEMDGHFSLGKAYKSSKRYNEAIESFKKSILIALKIDNKEVERDVYFQIGNIYECMNQYDQAISYIKKYMEAAKNIGDDNDVIEAYLSLGVSYLGLDQYENAFSNLSEGLKLATDREDTTAIESFNHFLSIFYTRIGDTGKASIPKSDDIDLNGPGGLWYIDYGTQRDGEGDSIKDRKPFHKQYWEHKVNNDYEKAIVCLRKHLEAYEFCPRYHSVEKVYCLIEIAKMHNELHQHERSLQCYQEALTIAKSVDAKHLQAECYIQQGQVYYILRRMKDAEGSFRRSVQCFEIMFDDLGRRDDFKMSLLDKYVHSYKNLVSILVHTKQLKQALLASDQSRARSLKDLLLHFGMNAETSGSQKLQYSDVESLVSNCSILFYSVCCQTVSTAYTFIIDSGEELQFSIKNVGTCIHGSNFEGCIEKALDEMTVRSVANCENRSLDCLRDEGNENPRSEQDEARTTTNRCQCDSEESEANKEIIKMGSALDELRHRLLHHDIMYSVKRDNSRKSLTYYGKQEDIVIIPDGPLYKVPFAALRDPDTGKYLSETKRIRLAPSLATLKLLQERTEDYYYKKGTLIVGDPLVGKVMFNGQETCFPPLEDAFCEALTVGTIFHEKPLTGEEATKPAVIGKLQQGVSVVHIAAHGSLAQGTIALAPSPEIRATKIPDEQDYMLTMADVQKTQVRAQLVVLSCCHSGRGEIRAEGVVGMCRAFLASGARAVVASLWAISDEATLEFMTEFYLNLRDGKSPSTSLQQAMNEMRNTSKYNQPKYWAPFFLMGDDVTLKF